MKALTVCQPYARLITIGAKRVENRTWYTPFRGALLIHAGKSRDWLDGDEEGRYAADPLEFGFIVGRCRVVHCLGTSGIEINARTSAFYQALLSPAHREHVNGPWCLVLDSIVRFAEPLPWRGAQGLFDVPDDVVARLAVRS